MVEVKEARIRNLDLSGSFLAVNFLITLDHLSVYLSLFMRIFITQISIQYVVKQEEKRKWVKKRDDLEKYAAIRHCARRKQ